MCACKHPYLRSNDNKSTWNSNVYFLYNCLYSVRFMLDKDLPQKYYPTKAQLDTCFVNC